MIVHSHGTKLKYHPNVGGAIRGAANEQENLNSALIRIILSII